MLERLSSCFSNVSLSFIIQTLNIFVPNPFFLLQMSIFQYFFVFLQSITQKYFAYEIDNSNKDI